MTTDLFAGIDYIAEFVPQSKSRNAKEKHLSLNWRIKITANRQTIETDYMQGIGHLPGYKHSFSGRKLVTEAECDKLAAETGRRHTFFQERYCAGSKLTPPTLRAVMASLILDASAIDAGSFENWADEFGYDKDSRAAEAIYNACVKTGLQLRAMLGDSRLAALREELQND